MTIIGFGRVIIQGDDPNADDAIVIEQFHFANSGGTLGAQREALREARERIDDALAALETSQVNIR